MQKIAHLGSGLFSLLLGRGLRLQQLLESIFGEGLAVLVQSDFLDALGGSVYFLLRHGWLLLK